MRISRNVGLVLVAGAAMVGTTACDDAAAADPDSQQVALTFAASSQAAAVTDPITIGANTLVVSDVDVVFSELVLERAEGELGDGDSDGVEDGDSDSESDSDSDGSWNEHFRSGPVTVALPLEGGVISPITAPIPFGVYEELELDIATVRLRGTWNGQAFDVTLPVDQEFEADLEPPFVVDDASDLLNITIALAVNEWFIQNGVLVDPAQLLVAGQVREAFIARIEASFDAFEDSDRDADDSDSDSDSD